MPSQESIITAESIERIIENIFFIVMYPFVYNAKIHILSLRTPCKRCFFAVGGIIE